jgi:hypothetical protein
MDNRRISPRVKVNCFIWYRYAGALKNKVVMSINISTAGVMFLADEYLPLDTKVGIKLKMPNMVYPIELEGRVVRSESGLGLKFFKTAIKFINPSSEIKACLKASKKISK